MLIDSGKILIQEENGSFDKNAPITLDFTTIPGRGPQSAFCCAASSGKSQVIGFDIGENFGALVTGHHNCNHGPCPVCFKHWLLSETFYALAYLEAVKTANPGCEVFQLRFTFRKQGDVTRNDIADTFEVLLRHCKKPKKGIYGGIAVLHNIQVKKFVEDKINQCYERDYEESLTRTKMYWAATDLDYLHHIGFHNFHNWREAVDLFWHIHVFIVADHYPSELYLHGNMKKSAAKFLSGGPVKEISHNSTDNNSTTPNIDLTTRPDGTPRNWVAAKVKDHTDPYEGSDLVHSLRYAFSHCTLSNFQGLEFKALHRFGDCRKLKLDFIHDKPWTEEEFRLNPDTGEEELLTVQKYPDSRVTSAYATLQHTYPHIHRCGKFVYPGHERAPTINEDLPAKRPYKTPFTQLNIQLFKLPTIYDFATNTRIPADGAEFTYKRQDTFVKMLREAEEIGRIPIFPIKLSDSVEGAFKTLNDRCLNSSLRGKDRFVYSSDFKGFEDFDKAGRVNSLGYISKATAYRFPTQEEFEKFRYLKDTIAWCLLEPQDWLKWSSTHPITRKTETTTLQEIETTFIQRELNEFYLE